MQTWSSSQLQIQVLFRNSQLFHNSRIELLDWMNLLKKYKWK